MAKSFSFNSVDMSTYGLRLRKHNLDDFQLSTEYVQLKDRAYPAGTVVPALEVEMEVAITATSYSQLCSYLDSIKAAINSRVEKALAVDSKTDRYWMAHTGKLQKKSNTARTWEGYIIFERSDPFSYSTAETDHDHTLNETPETFTETAGGTEKVRPVITVTSGADHGEITLEVENETTGEVFEWTGTLDTDDVLVIDCEDMTVELNGVASMSSVDGEFPALMPGANTVNVTGLSDAVVNFTYRARFA